MIFFSPVHPHLCFPCTFYSAFLRSPPPSAETSAIHSFFFFFTKFGAASIPTKCSLSQPHKNMRPPARNLRRRSVAHAGAVQIAIRDANAAMPVITDSASFSSCISVLHPLELFYGRAHVCPLPCINAAGSSFGTSCILGRNAFNPNIIIWPFLCRREDLLDVSTLHSAVLQLSAEQRRCFDRLNFICYL